MEMSQYDYRMYQDELESLRDSMTALLLEMERRHDAMTAQEFERWWNEEGNLRRYYDMKGRSEVLERTLAYAQVREEPYPRMRRTRKGNIWERPEDESERS